MAYATTAQLESRWRALSPDEAATASALLDDAAVILDGIAPHGVSDEILSIVSCNMVRRAMTTDGDAFALGGQVVSNGWSSTAPAGDLWLSAQDRRFLRRGAQVGTAQMESL